MNQIQKYETNKETHLLEIILAKNRIIITDLENILMGLTLAKLNIVSPAILDGADVSEFRHKQPIIYISLVEILEVSSVSVFQNSDIMHFLITFPNPKLVCKRITVYPVQRQNRILNFESGNLVPNTEPQYRRLQDNGRCRLLQGTKERHMCSTDSFWGHRALLHTLRSSRSNHHCGPRNPHHQRCQRNGDRRRRPGTKGIRNILINVR